MITVLIITWILIFRSNSNNKTTTRQSLLMRYCSLLFPSAVCPRDQQSSGTLNPTTALLWTEPDSCSHVDQNQPDSSGPSWRRKSSGLNAMPQCHLVVVLNTESEGHRASFQHFFIKVVQKKPKIHKNESEDEKGVWNLQNRKTRTMWRSQTSIIFIIIINCCGCGSPFKRQKAKTQRQKIHWTNCIKQETTSSSNHHKKQSHREVGAWHRRSQVAAGGTTPGLFSN